MHWHEGNLASETHRDSNDGQPPPRPGARGSPSSDPLPRAIMRGRESTDQASKQRPVLVSLTSGPGGPTGPGGPCQREVQKAVTRTAIPICGVLCQYLVKQCRVWKSLLASQLLAPALVFE